MQRSRTASLLRAALVAALIAVSALITIPLGPVPVTLQVLAIAVAALVLSPAEALASVTLYLALGAFGVPVFSGGGAGLGVLVGPTGGFLLGFLVGTPAAALVRRRLAGGSRRDPDRGVVLADSAAVLVLLAITYSAGLVQFAAVTGRSGAEAFALAVAPFVLIDLGKAAIAMVVARGVRSAGLGDRKTAVDARVC